MTATDPLDRLAATPAGSLLLGLTMPDGHSWAVSASPFQIADAAGFLDDGPRLHFVTRPRGGRKSTDAAALVLALLLTEAPPGARAYGFAADQDQAALLIDSVRQFVEATPGLAGAVTVTERKVVVRDSGASFEAYAADAASAYGLRPWLTVVDEFAAWPGTRSAGRVWEAAFSATPKVTGSRLLIITSAGDPASLAHKVLVQARTSDRWRVSETRGPLGYLDPADLAEQRAVLLPSAYARLHENRWTAPEDSLLARDLLDALVTHSGPLDPVPGCTYRGGLDIGLTNDATVLTVAHVAPADRTRVVVDLVHRLQGTKRSPVALADVEAAVLQAHRTYPGLKVRLDPWQGVGSAQRLRSHGVQIEEWPFTAVSVGRLAGSLFRVLHEGRIGLPDDEALLAEIAAVRLRPNSTGAMRIDHEAGGHDDMVISLGLAVLALTERPVIGQTRIASPLGRVSTSSVRDGSVVDQILSAAHAPPPYDPRSAGLPPAELRFPNRDRWSRW